MDNWTLTCTGFVSEKGRIPVSLPSISFDGAVCFTMLHHIKSAELQNKLFAEVARVLRPGAIFPRTDRLKSLVLRLIHLFDTFVTVDPKTLPRRLTSAGFENVKVESLRNHPRAFPHIRQSAH